MRLPRNWLINQIILAVFSTFFLNRKYWKSNHHWNGRSMAGLQQKSCWSSNQHWRLIQTQKGWTSTFVFNLIPMSSFSGEPSYLGKLKASREILGHEKLSKAKLFPFRGQYLAQTTNDFLYPWHCQRNPLGFIIFPNKFPNFKQTVKETHPVSGILTKETSVGVHFLPTSISFACSLEKLIDFRFEGRFNPISFLLSKGHSIFIFSTAGSPTMDSLQLILYSIRLRRGDVLASPQKPSWTRHLSL